MSTTDAERWADSNGFAHGQQWENEEGHELVDLLKGHAVGVKVAGVHADSGEISEYGRAYRFPDGSLIWPTGAYWDIIDPQGRDGSGEWTVTVV